MSGRSTPRPRALLDAEGLRSATIAVPAGEGSKSFAAFARLCDAVLDARIERGDCVLALGGGVVGDLAGFAAASVRRGVRFVQVPTTLLAQVDSSVGGKTGINSPTARTSSAPSTSRPSSSPIPGLLDSLPEREMRRGYAEVVKYGLIDGPGFFVWCEANWRGIFAGGPERDEAVAVSCRAKAAVVARDEREEGDRALPQPRPYLRACAGAGDGLRFPAPRAWRGRGRRTVPRVPLLRTSRALPRRRCGPRRSPSPGGRPADAAVRNPGGAGSVDELLDAMGQDKKVKGGALTFILARGIGQGFIAPELPQATSSFLTDESKSPA